MSEKARFYNMTKPIKFRALRQFFKSVGLTYEVGKERIKYLFNYLLYLLNIYKKYNYRDNVETEYDLSGYLKRNPLDFHKVVNSTFVTANIKVRAIKTTFIEREYFYYINRKGETVKTLVLKDSEHSVVTFTGKLEKIGVRIAVNEPFHFTQGYPRYRIAKSPVCRPVFTEDITGDIQKVQYTEYEVDLEPVINLRCRHQKTLHEERLTVGEVLYVFNFMEEEFEKALNNMKFTDLLRQV